MLTFLSPAPGEVLFSWWLTTSMFVSAISVFACLLLDEMTFVKYVDHLRLCVCVFVCLFVCLLALYTLQFHSYHFDTYITLFLRFVATGDSFSRSKGQRLTDEKVKRSEKHVWPYLSKYRSDSDKTKFFG